ncbi:MAG: hypothetical protein KDJ65_36020 [Anaerolineae bacterium]|nr:hypothetical protein [Anaerolineae bacterium]
MMLNWGIALIVVNSLLVSVSSVFFKLGAQQVSLKYPISMITNTWVLLGIALTPGTLILNVSAYRFGDVSALHPLLQLSLVWNMGLAIIIFKETVRAKTLLGTILILSGAIFITFGP